MDCTHCGEKLEGKTKFCDKCGLELPKSKKEELKLRKDKLEEQKKERKIRKSTTKKIGLGLLILLIITALIFLPTKTQAYTVKVPYTTTEPYQTQEAYQVQVPYQTQESYTDYETKIITETITEDDCDQISDCVCLEKNWLGLGDTCVKCSCERTTTIPTTKYKTVTEHRTETRYKTVTKHRDVTRTRDETRYRKVNWIFGECFYLCG